MSFYEETIPASDYFKQAVANGLVEAENNTNEHFSQFDTTCGKDQYVWNQRYKYIRDRLPEERYRSTVRKKNRWHYIAIMDDEIDCLNILLNDNRFFGLVRRPDKDLQHYSKSPALRNADLDSFDVVREQICLNGWDPNYVDEQTIDFRKGDLAKLECIFQKTIKRYVIVTFKPSVRTLMESLSAHLVDSMFRLKKSESWDGWLPSGMQPFDPDIDGGFRDIKDAIILQEKTRIDRKPEPKILAFPKSENNN